ncbi:glycosyltransferase family 92 protein RCOM_0530710 [Andrographis paniculata]|uniref:glycosyltransferase family 92 protein RCOM_0530710 n=1 Tax=Andrographis paniculata TaxID=175694 RepID=UPI0021E79CB1|nr:glycosyltransferase family 92 protein RCOM_0530710 [Andrographis paniculata]
MNDHRSRRGVSPWIVLLFWCILLLFALLTNFSTLRLLLFQGHQPRLVSRWNNPATMEMIVGENSATPAAISVRERVLLPDEALLFLKYHRPPPPSSSAALLTKADLTCIYYYASTNSSSPQLQQSPPTWLETRDENDLQIVRCPAPTTTHGMIVSLAFNSKGNKNSLTPPAAAAAAGPTYKWDSLAYEAAFDDDDESTIVFVKGLNLRSGKAAAPSRYKCLFYIGDSNSGSLLRSDVVSAAQEIVRCRTPSPVLNAPPSFGRDPNPIKVSVKAVGKRALDSVARIRIPAAESDRNSQKQQQQHRVCMCTMVRNQARFLREWVMYHSRIGVERWFIYDNNSNDDLERVVESLNQQQQHHNVTRHSWPWIKSQEAGFAHCALRARDSCQWVAFTDVDEFFHMPAAASHWSLHDVISSSSDDYYSDGEGVGEIRVWCRSFGPSGLKQHPERGVMGGYTCRAAATERHKSIVRADALNSSLINVVHHFHLKSGFRSLQLNTTRLVINHYKYQVWAVFKDKFYRRVATYVSDWQEERNVDSKDRAPGLGTKPVEPPDWSARFCEVQDTALRDWVLRQFADPATGLLPWQIRNPEEERMTNAEGSGPEIMENGKRNESLFSPRFRSVAAMAGWDEEALLIASLVVEDTPDRQLKHKKRSGLHSFITPPTNSTRKRRAQRRSPASKPVAILDLEEDVDVDDSNAKQESEKKSEETTSDKQVEKTKGGYEEGCRNTSTAAMPFDKLREELSCAICLEICYEPSTTPCGHSFCKRCLRSAADKCGKRCPKCRQLISNSRYCCTVNTVLWNTIQLLFPQEVEARKAAEAAAVDSHARTTPPAPARSSRRVREFAAALNIPESSERRNQNRHRHRHLPRRVQSGRELPSQDEDAALALRLQREEFMEVFNSGSEHGRRSSSSGYNSSAAAARANLRAMASRAANIRIRGQHHH